MTEYYIFNADQFGRDMQELMGGRYISILADITGTSYNGALRWCKQEKATKNGPNKDRQMLISEFLKKNYSVDIKWNDYLIKNTSIDQSFESRKDLLKKIEDLSGKIKALEKELEAEREKNLALRIELCGKQNVTI